MMELLISKICGEISITEFEQEKIKSHFKIKILNKKELLLKQGSVLSELYFVETGMLIAYIKGNDGKEHILQFAEEGAWMLDNFDQPTDVSSLYNIQAIEDTQILSINYQEVQILIEAIPSFSSYIRIAMQERLSNLHWRIIIHLVCFAEDRYCLFLHCYPDIAQRVPLYMIAAYLGLKPETLSRCRRKIATKKGNQNTFSSLINDLVIAFHTSEAIVPFIQDNLASK